MGKERNGKVLRVGLIIALTTVAATTAVAVCKQVFVNTGDIKETKTIVRMMREEQSTGFAHLEKVIKEGRK